MSERRERSLREETDGKPQALLKKSSAGHPHEYTLHLAGYGHDEHIPPRLTLALKEALDEHGYDVSDRGSRIEIMFPYDRERGDFAEPDDALIQETVIRIIGQEKERLGGSEFDLDFVDNSIGPPSAELEKH